MHIGRQGFVAAILLLCSTQAFGDSLLWTTGAPNFVYQDGCGCFGRPTPSRFGYISGRLDSASPQRWAAVPFRLDEPSRINELDAYYTDPNGTVKEVDYIIWKRDDLLAPTTMVASGSLGPYAAAGGSDLATQDLHKHTVDVSLARGDYYLTMYGSGLPGQTAYIGWWAGGSLQDPLLEQNFVWRSAKFPSPGFQHYTYTGSANLLADPKDVYNPAFALYGEPVPEPAGFGLFTLGLVIMVAVATAVDNTINSISEICPSGAPIFTALFR